MAVEILSSFFICFITLLIIIDPFMSLLAFISLTRNSSPIEKSKQALIAVGVAAALMIVFLFSGLYLLDKIGISFPSFVIAGAIILLILGIQEVLGLEFSNKKEQKKAAAIIIGTPLLSGPGALTTIIILSQKFGYWIPLVALAACLIITWIMLHYSHSIVRHVNHRLVEVLSRILGLLLAALAIEFLKNGIIEIVKSF